ncbi:MAG: Myb-like DNA-binding domain-containing protein [Clostridia bacterium]|nr:Myb-like DNA-binding domain-containing protein [Clostridia bacterium]
MKQTHFGWSAEEDALLLKKAREAKASGASMQSAFQSVAEQTNRMPNSVRNRYYTALKDAAAPPQFVPFTERESDELVRSVLLAKEKGESVRACTLRLAEGDTRRMLRYQNKYRAMLRSTPDRVRAIRESLLREGYQVPDPFREEPSPHVGRPRKATLPMAAIRRLLDALYDDLVALSCGETKSMQS